LPPEHNFIAIYKSLNAHRDLALIFENRRQFERAAHYWRLALGSAADVPSPDAPVTHDEAREHLRQILGRWGTFADEEAPAGRPTSVAFRFRNATSVRFEAHALDVNRLIADVKAYLRSDPGDWDWSKMNLNDIGQRIVWEGQEKYRGRRVAALGRCRSRPAPGISTGASRCPCRLRRTGHSLSPRAWKGGNTSHLVVWRDELALVQKPIGDGDFYFVADAATGRPVSGAVSGFLRLPQRVHRLPHRSPAHENPHAGFFPDGRSKRRRDGGRGGPGTGPSMAGGGPRRPGAARVFGVPTLLVPVPVGRRNRPGGGVPRSPTGRSTAPSRVVRFRAWADRAAHDRTGPSPFAGAAFSVTIYDPQGKKVFERSVAADARGGFDGEFPLPADAALGAYSLAGVGAGPGVFVFPRRGIQEAGI
jgi:hypothetical protein